MDDEDTEAADDEPNVCGYDEKVGRNVRVWDNPQEPSSKWILEVDNPEANCSGISPWRLPSPPETGAPNVLLQP